MSVTQSDSAHMICVRISQSRCHCETLTVSVSFAPTPSHTELSTLFSSDCDQNPTVSNLAQFWQPEAPPAKKQASVFPLDYQDYHMMRGMLKAAVAFTVTAVIAFVRSETGDMPCQTGSACSNVTGLVWTVNNTDYCCQDSSVKPHMTLLPNITCTCSVDPYAGLPLGEQIKLWATLNMDEGRFCQYGDKACYGSPYNITANDDKLKFCCRKPPYLSRRITFTVVEYEFVGCLCTVDHPPARSAPEYVVPSAWGQYNSSGEECYFNQDCDDYPIQKCVGPLATFCCYRSRGMVTSNVNSTTTGCTCTQEFLGTDCELNPRPLPEWTSTTSECLASCRDVAEENKCFGRDQQVRCCPPTKTMSAKIVDGKFTECTCGWPAGNATCTRHETSTSSRVTTQTGVLIAFVVVLAMFAT